MNGTSIVYDTHSLQTASIFTEEIQHENSANKNAQMYAIGHANRSVIPYVGYTSKDITLMGTIVAADIATLDGLLDTFRGYFTGKDKNLDIGYSSGIRRYIATATVVNISRPHGLSYAKFNITMACTQPFGVNVSSTALLSITGRTSGIYSDAVTFLGSAPYQLPIRTIAYTALSGGTGATVYFGNNANGQQVSVTRNWISGDTFATDVINKLVLINGASVDFVGAFPEFPPGPQSMSYSDNFTTRTFNDNVIQYPLWV
jgi:hypothetical protein